MAERRNGYFQVNVASDGTYIHFFPAENGGEPIDLKEMDNYLSTKCIPYDKRSLHAEADKNKATKFKLNSSQIRLLDEYMMFSVSSDSMSVIARFFPPSEGGGLMTEDEIKKDLQYNKIKAEPDMEAINSFLSDRQYCTDYIIARGTPVTPGKDGYVEYLFDTDPVARPKTNADGSVDFHALNSVRACAAGQVIAKVHPEEHGEPGFDVFGEMIMPKDVKSTTVKHSNGSTLSEDGTLTADVDGHVTLTDGVVFVSSVLSVENVDASTGDLNYEGNLLVEGNINTGYKVNVTGDIEVKGVIEGAEVSAGGQITVAKGINGMERGIVKAGHSIIAKYINSVAEVSAGGLIQSELILNSNVSAKDTIKVEGKKGFITGGVARAGNKIEAKTIGSDMGTATNIEVGIDPSLKARHISLIKKNEEIRVSLSRTEPVLLATVERLKKGEKLPPDQLKKMQELNKVIQQQKETMNKNMEELIQLEEIFDSDSIAEVVVYGTAFTGTHISVSDAHLTLKKDYQYCRFRREGADVRMAPI
ncbi:MAG: FapA family protein [Lachnospiraceae bacterium]|nr:FapA family protein [Lachnospiraceae bacterium]